MQRAGRRAATAAVLVAGLVAVAAILHVEGVQVVLDRQPLEFGVFRITNVVPLHRGSSQRISMQSPYEKKR